MTVRTTSGWVVGVAVLTLTAGTALSADKPRPRAQEGGGTLSGEVSRLIAARKLGQARVGVCLYDSNGASMLADVGGDDAFTPASNHKLLTTGTAALVLGPDFVFKTEIVLDGDRLIVRGGGDPALADPEILSEMKPTMSVADVLGVLGGAVAKADVKSVREIVVDDRVFDRQWVHPEWPKDQLHNKYACQISGVNFHGNALAIYMRPSRDGVGRPPALSTQPEAPWLQITNKARTISTGRNTAWLQRDDGSNAITLIGEVKSDTSAEVTIDGPGLFFGQVLAAQLTKSGVTIGDAADPAGAASRARLVEPGEVLGEGRVVAVVNTPIAEVLKKCNTESDNLYAESLMKRVSNAVTHEPGSWENGAAVVRMMLTQKLGGTAASETTVSDGSGLSRKNAVSPATMVRWLDALAEDPKVGKGFVESLATPGSGTLRRRFTDAKLRNELHAKSGFINGVRSLSGYLVNPDTGRRVCFSVIVNDLKGDEHDFNAKQLAEDVVKRADRWLAERGAGAGAGGGGGAAGAGGGREAKVGG